MPFPLLRRGADWLDALWPRACAGCGATPGDRALLCPACEAQLRSISTSACPHCQLHPASAAGHCAARPATDPLAGAWAAVWLEAPASDWIHAFKYPARGLSGLAPGPAAATRELARRAARQAPADAPRLVVPVPLHPRRLRARGFNPAALLARSVAREKGVAFDARALGRLRDTPSQTGLAPAARRRNVAKSMRARRRVPAEVWLVDDVVTTGATAREAARALRAGGARRVWLLAAARTPLRGATQPWAGG